jgi:NAD(P)-dependent dehydrogenase (short-subunit alcohol dehydrogenase family)
MNEKKLEGHVAIVTGTTSGIGRATALALAGEGATVIGVARRADDGEHRLTDAASARGGSYLHISGDAKESSTASSVVERALTEFGRIDSLINNAGIGNYADFVDSDVDLYDDIMDTNMRSTFLFSRAVVPTMIAQGSGLLLQVASQAGLRGFTHEAIYCASKHAQVGFTRALRQELQPFGIKVGVICPAGVATDFAIGNGRTTEFVEQAGFLTAEDVADAILFTAMQSKDARMVEMSLISLGEAL